MLIRQAVPGDYPAILALQAQNTPDHLTPQQRQQGFIVSQMNEQQLANINHGLGILVVTEDEQLAGFVCLMPTDTQPRPPVVDAMLHTLAMQRFQDQALDQQRVFLYGPVCLSAEWRGKGVLRQLLAAVKARTQQDFDVGALFVDEDNLHSLAAHVAGLGMTALTTFHCNNQSYQLVVFATRS
ncbi:GNAT family N-acetyltransferase [Serratia fonticola]|uniref:GNAT family N-acetyltransferase n=1 Tax=Serratia fonticola TaxID=47917 RepID=UPI0021AD560F|nr:GNAT family N-acetyltransferase [Serratia fonticola]